MTFVKVNRGARSWDQLVSQAKLLPCLHIFRATSSLSNIGSCEKQYRFCSEPPELGGLLICSYHSDINRIMRFKQKPCEQQHAI